MLNPAKKVRVDHKLSKNVLHVEEFRTKHISFCESFATNRVSKVNLEKIIKNNFFSMATEEW
jgi:hypothetical protein